MGKEKAESGNLVTNNAAAAVTKNKPRAAPIRRLLWEVLGAHSDTIRDMSGRVYALDKALADQVQAAAALILGVSEAIKNGHPTAKQ